MKLGVSDSFRGRADAAAFWEAWIATVLSRAGLYTLQHTWEVPENGPGRKDYSLSHDLDVSVEHPSKGGPVVEVEVKSLNTTFSRSSDYPYPSVIVCSQNSFLRKWPGSSKTGRDFLFVSRITGNIVWLPMGTPITVGHATFDSSRNESYSTVHAKKSDLKELVDFVESVRGT